MALQTIPGGLQWPGMPLCFADTTSYAFLTNLMNTLSEYCGAVFIAPATITVRKIGFYVSAISAFVGTVDARIETVDLATGRPTGTQVGTGAAFTPAAQWFWVTLAADASLTGGTAYYAGTKITAYTSGSFTQAAGLSGIGAENLTGMPYSFSAAISKDDVVPVIGLELSDGTKVVVPGVIPVTSVASENWSSASNPDRRGLRFQVPFPTRLIGFHMWGVIAANFTWQLYGSDGVTVLQSRAEDKDVQATATIEHSIYPIPATPIVKGTFYRLVILPGDGTARDWMVGAVVNAAADFDCWPGGQNFHWTQVNGAPTAEGDWTNTLTKRPVAFSLLFDQFEDGAAAAPIGMRSIIGRRRVARRRRAA